MIDFGALLDGATPTIVARVRALEFAVGAARSRGSISDAVWTARASAVQAVLRARIAGYRLFVTEAIAALDAARVAFESVSAAPCSEVSP